MDILALMYILKDIEVTVIFVYIDCCAYMYTCVCWLCIYCIGYTCFYTYLYIYISFFVFGIVGNGISISLYTQTERWMVKLTWLHDSLTILCFPCRPQDRSPWRTWSLCFPSGEPSTWCSWRAPRCSKPSNTQWGDTDKAPGSSCRSQVPSNTTDVLLRASEIHMVFNCALMFKKLFIVLILPVLQHLFSPSVWNQSPVCSDWLAGRLGCDWSTA